MRFIAKRKKPQAIEFCKSNAQVKSNVFFRSWFSVKIKSKWKWNCLHTLYLHTIRVGRYLRMIFFVSTYNIDRQKKSRCRLNIT